MAFRFRRSISIVPGVRLNVGKRGVSLSAGRRGASVTAGRRGVYGNVGAPGTGMSYRTRLDKSKAHRRRSERQGNKGSPDTAQGGMSLTLNLENDGKLTAKDSQGDPVANALLRRVFKENPTLIRDWLIKECDKLNGDMDLILNIHEDAPGPDTPAPEFTAEPFTATRPEAPDYPALPEEPETPMPRKSCFAWIIPGFQKRAEARYEQDLAEWQQAHARWSELKAEADATYQKALAEYEQALADWQAARDQHDLLEDARAENFDQLLREDTELMASVLESEIDALDWPFAVAVDFDLSDDASAVWLDVDLPNPDVMPQREARLGAREDRLVIKNKSARQLREEYARHVHGVVVRLAGTVLVSLPGVDAAIISAYRQTLNTGTGFEEDEYLISAKVQRDNYFTLNFNDLSKVDPIAAMDEVSADNLRRNMTKTGLFKPIQAFEP